MVYCPALGLDKSSKIIINVLHLAEGETPNEIEIAEDSNRMKSVRLKMT